ncbi:unnamed protein product, partial [Closterium sp. Naga37s-1]
MSCERYVCVLPLAMLFRFPRTGKNRKGASVASVFLLDASNGVCVLPLATPFRFPRTEENVARALQWRLSPSTEKKIRKGASVASVLCNVDSTDVTCDALGCVPGGTCEVDRNGNHFCLWDSPCGECPTGATCKSFPSATASETVALPYCACPEGSGITPTECVAGGTPTVSSHSFTYIMNRKAKDRTSRPYTFRLNLNACTQFPEGVAGLSMYCPDNTGDAPTCSNYKLYEGDNCDGNIVFEGPYSPFAEFAL